MGADLYVRKMYKYPDDILFNVFYFRDSYNDSNISWLLEICYGNYNEEECKELLEEVLEKKEDFIKVLEEMDEESRKYFEWKYIRLVRFLRLCIRHGGMIASL